MMERGVWGYFMITLVMKIRKTEDLALSTTQTRYHFP